MPLLKGKQNIGHNIEEMEKAGHPHDQSVAAAMNTAYGPAPKHDKYHINRKLMSAGYAKKGRPSNSKISY